MATAEMLQRTILHARADDSSSDEAATVPLFQLSWAWCFTTRNNCLECYEIKKRQDIHWVQQRLWTVRNIDSLFFLRRNHKYKDSVQSTLLCRIIRERRSWKAREILQKYTSSQWCISPKKAEIKASQGLGERTFKIRTEIGPCTWAIRFRYSCLVLVSFRVYDGLKAYHRVLQSFVTYSSTSYRQDAVFKVYLSAKRNFSNPAWYTLQTLLYIVPSRVDPSFASESCMGKQDFGASE